MKRSIILLTTALFMVLNCAPYKMKAIRAQRDHHYDFSIQFALKHLTGHPDDQSIMRLLDEAARGYYQGLQQRIQHFENLNDWDKVVVIAEDGYRTLSEVTKVVGTNFPTKNELSYLQSKSQQSKFNQAEALYSAAKKFYENNDYLMALENFKQIESLVTHFKDTDQLIADIHQKLAAEAYQQAKNLLSQGNLESALELFQQTAQYVPDFLDVQNQITQVKERLADSYFNQGQNYFNSSNYKDAYHALTKSLNYKSDHVLAKELLNETCDKLTVRLAVFPFAAAKLDPNFGGIVSQQILSHALPRKTEFITFLEREHLQKIFEEQALSQTGAIDEKTAVQVGKLSGVNTIVVGSVTLISEQTTGPNKRTLTAYYDKKYRDPKGVQRTKKEPFNYTEYEVSRIVEVNLNYRLISVETGAILFNESFSERTTDATQWLTCPTEFVQHLSASERNKLKASKEPQSRESLINQAIDSLTNKAASTILAQITPF